MAEQHPNLEQDTETVERVRRDIQDRARRDPRGSAFDPDVTIRMPPPEPRIGPDRPHVGG